MNIRALLYHKENTGIMLKAIERPSRKIDIGEVIDRAQATLIMLLSLEPEEFNFEKYVSAIDEKSKTICGTICCTAGWYPKYFPNSKIQYYLPVGNTLTANHVSLYDVDFGLLVYHGIKSEIIDWLFYGVFEPANDKVYNIPVKLKTLSIRATLEDVIEAWSTLIQLLDSEHYFKLVDKSIVKIEK